MAVEQWECQSGTFNKNGESYCFGNASSQKEQWSTSICGSARPGREKKVIAEASLLLVYFAAAESRPGGTIPRRGLAWAASGEAAAAARRRERSRAVRSVAHRPDRLR